MARSSEWLEFDIRVAQNFRLGRVLSLALTVVLGSGFEV